MSGLVSIIGSGPGDPDLITKKGIDRLREADVVFHDKLSPNTLLEEYCRDDAEIHDVGKRKGKEGPDQSEINRHLVEAAEAHDRVVRLKGGDPFLFGRGGEETEYLAKHDVEFEIVPGVSSLTAVPAAAGIPLTHREHSSSVGVVTGHFNRNAVDETHDWSALAGLETIAVLMGVTRSGSIAENLIDAGKSPETPVSVIGWGATPRQNTHVTTLEELTEGLDEPSEYLPGLLVVGDVVECKQDLNWYEEKPLFGKNIIVTRPSGQSDRLADPLEEAGARTLSCPTIEIKPLEKGLNELRELLGTLEEFDWLVFTSRNAVRYFFQTLESSPRDIRALGSLNVACIGPGTAERLAGEGIDADLIPGKHRAESLRDELLETLSPKSSVLMPRSADARAHLAEQLKDADHDVTEIGIYHADHPGPEVRSQLKEYLRAGDADMITFTSSSTVENLFEALDEETVTEGLQSMETAAIGPITAETLQSHGVSASLVPENYNLDSFLHAIVDFYRTEDKSEDH